MKNWKLLKELNEKRGKAFADAGAIRDKARTENRDLTAEETTQHDALLADVEKIGREVERETRAGVLGEQLPGNGNNPARQDVDPAAGDRGTANNRYGIAEKDFAKYSLIRAIKRKVDGLPLDGVEAEVSDAIAEMRGKKPNGFYFPLDHRIPAANRVLDTTQGAGAIPTIVSEDFIEILRARLCTVKSGASVLNDLRGNFAIPKQTATSTAYWVSESGAPSGSQPVLGQVLFTPKTVGGYTDISRRFLENATVSAEPFVRDDLSKTIAIAIEAAAIAGTGTGNQPLGIIPNLLANAPGQIHAQGTNGGALGFTDAVAVETLVALQNADVNQLGYITNSKVRGAAKTTPKSASAVAAGFLWENDTAPGWGMMNGYKAGVTNIVPSNYTKGTGTGLSALVFGDWSSLVYGFWGGLDILVDPYTQGTTGAIRIVALQDVDVEVRHLESFAAITDIVA